MKIGRQRASSVRLPIARAKNAPARSGRNSTSTKYKAATSPRTARPSAICHAPPNPRLHQVHVPKIGTSERRMRFGMDLVPTTDRRNRNQTDNAAINAAKARPGKSLIRFTFCRTATGTMLRTAPKGKTEYCLPLAGTISLSHDGAGSRRPKSPCMRAEAIREV